MQKTYNRVVQAVYATPWAILPEKLREILAFLYSKQGRELAESTYVEKSGLFSGPTPQHTSPIRNEPWDGPANEVRVRSGEDRSYYRRIYGWEDPEGEDGAKSTYRFIHHQVSPDGTPGAANVIACQTGIGVLNGARGGTTIPGDDRRGVWGHLAAHLEDGGIEPPPLLGVELVGREQALGFGGEARRIGVQRVGDVAIVPVMGTITERASIMSRFSGGVSAEHLTAGLRELAADKSIASVILDVDSPGGSVGGMTELAAEIRALRDTKPVIGVANGLAASAGFWILSQASEVVVTPSGNVGSIGVFTAHEDHSAELEREGVKFTLVHAGKFKVEGNPFGPLDDEARAQIQGRVDAFFDMFIKDIAAGRKVTPRHVRSNFGEGRLLMAVDAKAAGMVDRIATMNDTIARQLRRSGRRRNRQPGHRAEVTTIREFEALLRDEADLSHAEAKRVAQSGWNRVDPPRDGDLEDAAAIVKEIESATQRLASLTKSPKNEVTSE